MTWITEIGDPFKCYHQTHIKSTHPLRPEVIIQQHDREADRQINGSTIRRPQTLGLFVNRIYGYYILNTATKILLNPADLRGQYSKHVVRRAGCVDVSHSTVHCRQLLWSGYAQGGLCLISLAFLVWYWTSDLGANFISFCHYKL